MDQFRFYFGAHPFQRYDGVNSFYPTTFDDVPLELGLVQFQVGVHRGEGQPRVLQSFYGGWPGPEKNAPITFVNFVIYNIS